MTFKNHLVSWTTIYALFLEFLWVTGDKRIMCKCSLITGHLKGLWPELPMTLRYLPLPLSVRRITELNQVLDLHQSFDCPLVLLITTSGSVLTACHYVHMSSGQSGEHPLSAIYYTSTVWWLSNIDRSGYQPVGILLHQPLCDSSARLTGQATLLYTRTCIKGDI